MAPDSSSDQELLPALPFDSWKDTLATLHMWAQVVGKVRLKLCPLVNHWWNVPFYLSARGLTTSAMPYGWGTVEIRFDFIDHKLSIETSEARVAAIALQAQSVAEFYRFGQCPAKFPTRLHLNGTGFTRPMIRKRCINSGAF